jgi:hypothetical protein
MGFAIRITHIRLTPEPVGGSICDMGHGTFDRVNLSTLQMGIEQGDGSSEKRTTYYTTVRMKRRPIPLKSLAFSTCNMAGDGHPFRELIRLWCYSSAFVWFS